MNLDAALSPAIKKAEEEKRKVLEAILALRVEVAVDERAILHLEDSGILPPSRDVELLLQCLLEQRIRCWSGWSYIENTVAEDQRREIVRQRPHVAAGVIVATVDYERTVEVLRHELPHLQSPVVVACPDAVNGDAPITWTVVGPTSDAHFSQTAGANELNETHGRKTRRAEEIATHDQWQTSLTALSHQLQSYRERYPTGWFAENALARKKCELEIEAQQRGIDEAERRDGTLCSEITSLTALERQLTDSCQAVGLHLDRLQAFVRQYGSKEADRVRARDTALEAAQKHRSQQKAQLEKAESRDHQADQSDSEATQAAIRAGKIEDELARVSHADPDSRHAAAGDLSLLRDQYRLLEHQYQEKVGSDTLRHLADQKDADARRERRELSRILAKTSDIKETDVAEELGRLPPGQSVEEAYEAAQRALWSAKQENGNDAQRKQRSEESLAQSEDTCRQLGITDELPDLICPDSAEESDEAAEAADRASLEDGQLAEMFEGDLAECQNALLESRQRIEVLRKDLTNLQGIAGDFRPLFDRVPVATEGGEAVTDAFPTVTEDAEVDGRTTSIREKLHACADSHEHLDTRREETAKDVHRWAREERFSKLTNSVAARFAEFGALALESKASYHIEKLELRLFHIDEKLQEADKQRDIVVRIILSAVDEALRLLSQVSRQSRLPQSLPGAGRRFLDITPSLSENPLDRRARVNELVDELLDTGDILDPVKLIQQAVRRVGSPIRVRLLHPDLEDASHRVSITEMQRFSDGERLTCAILLYCTLARLRAKQEGYSGDRSSVLMLDNPIGTASRVRFLDLQREVARAMNIQLIYATGVNDQDAIATLPNVIRLRNSRVDRRTGKRLVELERPSESDAMGQVEAVRVAFTRGNSRRAARRPVRRRRQ